MMMGGKKVSSPVQSKVRQKAGSIIVTEDEWEPGILEISEVRNELNIWVRNYQTIKPFVLKW